MASLEPGTELLGYENIAQDVVDLMNMLSFTLKTNRGPDFSHRHRLNTSGGSFV